MRESSAAAIRLVRSAFAVCFIVISGLAFAQVGGTPNSGQLVDKPTSCSSLSDRLVLSCAWAEGQNTRKTLLVVVPPHENLIPRVLEAEFYPPSDAGNPTSATVPRPAEWLNNQASIRSRMFSSVPIGYFRHYQIFEVRVEPSFRFQNTNMLMRTVRWEYRWTRPYQPARPLEDESLHRNDQGFGNLLPRLIANPDAMPRYGDPSPPEGELPAGLPGLTFSRLAAGKRPVLRLDIDKKALYRLDLDSIPVGSGGSKPDLESTHLHNLGQVVPLYLYDEQGATLELIFYGVPSDSKYTKENRYWLSLDPKAPPARMAEAPINEAWKSLEPEKSFPEALAIEQDNDLIIHADNFLTISDFRWVWGEIPAVDNPASVSAFLEEAPEEVAWFAETTFALPGMAEPKGQTQFEASFYISSPQLMKPVEVVVKINDAPPQTVPIRNSDELSRSFMVSNSLLDETSNTLKVYFQPGKMPEGDGVYFDRLVAHYRRRFEVPEHGFTFSSDPPTSSGWRHYALRGTIPPRPFILDVADTSKPRVIHSERDADGVLHFGQQERKPALYRVLSLDEISTPAVTPTASMEDVAEQKTPVDYLIISYGGFIDLLDPLVKSLEKSNWRVRVVDVENVYASFNWGLLGPDAIKAFLAYTLRNWPGGGPTYTLFVGDCTSDYRNDFRNDVKNYVPTYTLERGPRAEKWASEHWFTTLCGMDDYSDIIMGRLSVNSREDAKTVIDKIVRYREKEVLGPWRRRIAYVADGGESFADHSEQLRTGSKPPAFTGHRIYLDDFPWEDNFYLPPAVLEADIGRGHMAKVSPVMTTEILDTFNEGAAVITYRGHGSPNIWSDARVWFGGDSPNSDILMLRNGERLPLIVNLTCNSGAIDYPDPPWNLCISEDFHRSPTGGAVGLFVPTGPGIPTSHLRLSEEFHHTLFEENVRAMGDIVLMSKYRYLLRKHPLEMIKMFHFLGDPSCRLQLPQRVEPLEATPDIVSVTAGTTVKIAGRSDLGAGQKGTITLFSPKDDEVMSADLTFAADGRFEHALKLEPTDDPGSWTVRAYCWNESNGRDLAGWAIVGRVQPETVLEQFELRPNNVTLREGEPTTFVCVVANNSLLPADGIALEVRRSGEEGKVIKRIEMDLGPGEKRTFEIPQKAEAGFYRYTATLSGPAQSLGEPSPGFLTKTIDKAVPGAESESRVAILPESLNISITRAGNRFSRHITLMAAAIGDDPVGQVEAVLRDESGSTETRKLDKLEPGRPLSLAFSRPVDTTDLPQKLSLDLTYKRNPSSETATLEDSIEIKKADFPDLTIDAGRIRFIDEGNRVQFGDPTPTAGHTVFIDVPIRNVGGGPAAQAISLEAYDGDPKKGGKKMQSGVDSMSRNQLSYLYPDKEETIRLRWDPVNNAGDHQIHFRVDGEMRITESDETNNEVVVPLRVLTKGKLATEKIYPQPPASLIKPVQPLDAVVMNDGETTVRLVLVEYFLGTEQTDENKIGEVLVPEIGPNKQIRVRLDWKCTLDEFRRGLKEKFCFLARLKGSTQRVTSVPQD